MEKRMASTSISDGIIKLNSLGWLTFIFKEVNLIRSDEPFSAPKMSKTNLSLESYNAKQ